MKIADILQDISLAESPDEHFDDWHASKKAHSNPDHLRNFNSDYDSAIGIFCGDYISDEGQSRDVYEHTADPNKVIKFSPSMQNKMEAAAWQFIEEKQPHLKKWFAPVVEFDDYYLVQEKCERLAAKDDVPKRLPALFHWIDPKIGNFGILNGRFVCFDYGYAKQARDVRQILNTKALHRPVSAWCNSEGVIELEISELP